MPGSLRRQLRNKLIRMQTATRPHPCPCGCHTPTHTLPSPSFSPSLITSALAPSSITVDSLSLRWPGWHLPHSWLHGERRKEGDRESRSPPAEKVK